MSSELDIYSSNQSSNQADVAIRIQNVTKRYEIYDAPRDRLKQFILPRLRRMIGKVSKQYFREFSALTDVSFEVKKGETVGVIGRNGAGKSTLLQIICGTITPTSGTVEVNGRVAALLELGSGFNAEFTGRENVYMNAGVLGLLKNEIDERFENIVAFADIGEFIDQPVKTYSSGMYIRLAFAVIAHVDADILIIDEALSVGDIFFQQKCMRYLRALQEKGGTVLFVSHDTSAVVSLCNRAILLSRGKDTVVGKTDEICRMYIKDFYSERTTPVMTTPIKAIETSSREPISNQASDFFEGLVEGEEQTSNLIRITPFRQDADSFGSGGVNIVDIWFEGEDNSKLSMINGGDLVKFCIKAQSKQDIHHAAFGFMIKDRLGQYIFAEGSDLAYRNQPPALKSGKTILVTFSFLMPILIQGEYSLNVAVAEGLGDDHIQHQWINDAMALHSLKSRLVHGICGLQSLRIGIQVSSAFQSES
ncbi:ABC transporter ATP-binding protein [Glaciimonas sp. Gout2]|uniref:ABC transporter ATP-binding protein n=1 Tax=unclassified Glaciimonas TaxID=2644401 RepID=UPI002B2333DE|nr:MULTISPECIES: ABC transporter ATP-binding protein [unclassified Glaciimonas]MEB0013418.1 ABC transporter ATP-binding protein [Glaciimonas sp. Cout2]MEB0082671.1 ABC transporter ATP-binding protein [Glaciimonas sp. Gout2]